MRISRVFHRNASGDWFNRSLDQFLCRRRFERRFPAVRYAKRVRVTLSSEPFEGARPVRETYPGDQRPWFTVGTRPEPLADEAPRLIRDAIAASADGSAYVGVEVL